MEALGLQSMVKPMRREIVPPRRWMSKWMSKCHLSDNVAMPFYTDVSFHQNVIYMKTQ